MKKYKYNLMEYSKNFGWFVCKQTYTRVEAEAYQEMFGKLFSNKYKILSNKQYLKMYKNNNLK